MSDVDLISGTQEKEYILEALNRLMIMKILRMHNKHILTYDLDTYPGMPSDDFYETTYSFFLDAFNQLTEGMPFSSEPLSDQDAQSEYCLSLKFYFNYSVDRAEERINEFKRTFIFDLELSLMDGVIQFEEDYLKVYAEWYLGFGVILQKFIQCLEVYNTLLKEGDIFDHNTDTRG